MAFQQGDFAEAARWLELACFGFLDDPELLAEGLSRLALAQAALDDDEGYLATYQRLAEIEERFSAFGKADLTPELRAAIEDSLAQRIPAEVLALTPSLAEILQQAEASPIADPPESTDRQRTQQLERRVKNDATQLETRLQLAEVRLRAGKLRAALELSEQALALAPNDSRALCLHAASLTNDRSECDSALSLLMSCDETAVDAIFARAGLRCQIALERWEEASTFVASLPTQIREDRAIAKLTRTVDREVARAERAAPRPDSGTSESSRESIEISPRAAGSETAVGDSESPDPAGASFEALLLRLPPSDATRLNEANELLTDANTLSAVERALELAQRVADAYPEDREAQHFAAEIAYRSSRWGTALAYFRRGGDPGDDRPIRLFYLAVSAYEAGEPEVAAAALRRCRARLPDTAFVQRYTERILPGS